MYKLNTIIKPILYNIDDMIKYINSEVKKVEEDFYNYSHYDNGTRWAYFESEKQVEELKKAYSKYLKNKKLKYTKVEFHENGKKYPNYCCLCFMYRHCQQSDLYLLSLYNTCLYDLDYPIITG